MILESPLSQVDQENAFERLWAQYPANFKLGKVEAWRRFKKSVKTKEAVGRCQVALDTYKRCDRVRRNVVMNGKTFFSQWEDWYQLPAARKVERENLKPRTEEMRIEGTLLTPGHVGLRVKTPLGDGELACFNTGGNEHVGVYVGDDSINSEFKWFKPNELQWIKTEDKR